MGRATCSFPVFLVQGKKKTTVHKVLGRLGECDILCAWSLACRTEPFGSSDDQLSGWRSGSQRKRAVGIVRDICTTCVFTNYFAIMYVFFFLFFFLKLCSDLLLSSQGEFPLYLFQSQKRKMMSTFMRSPQSKVMHQSTPVCPGRILKLTFAFPNVFNLIIFLKEALLC